MTIYFIGDVEFHPAASEILHAGHSTHLQPQVSNVLECLAKHHGEVVTRDVLFNEAWQGRHTSDECLTRCISLLRDHLHDRDQRHLIETIPRIGYRLTGPVASCPELADDRRGSGFADRPMVGKVVKAMVLVAAVIVLLSGWLVAAGVIVLSG